MNRLRIIMVSGADITTKFESYIEFEKEIELKDYGFVEVKEGVFVNYKNIEQMFIDKS